MRPLTQGGRFWALFPAPRSLRGALMPCPRVLWAHPPSEARGQENHRAQGGGTLPPTGPAAPAPRLTHTFCCLLSVSGSHTAGASRSGCSHDHPQPPTLAHSFLCPRPLPAHSAHRLLAPLAKAQVRPPRSPASPLRLRPLPLPQLHSFSKRSLNTHQILGSIPGAEDPVGRRKKKK